MTAQFYEIFKDMKRFLVTSQKPGVILYLVILRENGRSRKINRLDPPFSRRMMVPRIFEKLRFLLVFLLFMVYQPTNAQHYFICPHTAKPIAGWSYVDKSCSNKMTRGIGFIEVRNFRHNLIRTYVYCCYQHNSLSRTFPPALYLKRTNKKYWYRNKYKSDLTNYLISEYFCGKPYTNTTLKACSLTNIPVFVQPKKPTQKLTKQQLIQLGERVYKKHCADCHKIDGKGMPPYIFPLKKASIMYLPIDATAHLVICGKEGTIMQPFGAFVFNSKLSDIELASVITYIRNHWGNNTLGKHSGGSMQPSDIKNIRCVY